MQIENSNLSSFSVGPCAEETAQRRGQQQLEKSCGERWVKFDKSYLDSCDTVGKLLKRTKSNISSAAGNAMANQKAKDLETSVSCLAPVGESLYVAGSLGHPWLMSLYIATNRLRTTGDEMLRRATSKISSSSLSLFDSFASWKRETIARYIRWYAASTATWLFLLILF